MKKFLKDKRGYSLVELMVVITIMAILAAASTPVFHGYIKKAKSSKYLAACRAVYMATEAHLIGWSGEDEEDVDFDNLEEEVESLTGLEIEILADTEDMIKEDYGIVVVHNRDNKWICEAVVCKVDSEVWMFDTESGTFENVK